MDADVEQVLRNERRPNLNFRNMLSAHTTNRKGGPLGPGGNLQSCFSIVRVNGEIEGHLNLPHSYNFGDCIPLHARSNLHPSTRAGEKEAFNEACLRGLIALLTKSPSQVRLTPSNFRRGNDSMQEVLKAARCFSDRPQPEATPIVAVVEDGRKMSRLSTTDCGATPICCRARASFDPVRMGYIDDKYVQMQPGDRVKMLKEDGTGWAYGFVHGVDGWFPREYVELEFDPMSSMGRARSLQTGALVVSEQALSSKRSARNLDLAEVDDATQVTAVLVPRCVRDRIPAIAKQIKEQDHLARMCETQFETLADGIEYALMHGFINNVKARELWKVNYSANQAKHCAYGPNSISPWDSASQVTTTDIHDDDRQHLPTPFDVNSPSIISLSSVRTDQPEHCFMSGALFRTVGNALVQAKDLQEGYQVLSPSGIVDIVSVQLHVGEELIVHLQTATASLKVTGSHRIPTQRGQSMQIVPASGLRDGDLVRCSGGIMEPLVRVCTSFQHEQVARIVFRPDVPVEAFPPLTSAILSNGHRRQSRRNNARQSNDVSNGFPNTDDEFR